MAKMIEKTGKSVDEALNAALDELGVGKDDVDVEVLETPSKGIFGIFGTKPARIKVIVKEPSKSSSTQIDDDAEKVDVTPSTVSFQLVQNIDSLPKVDAEFKPKDEILTANAKVTVAAEKNSTENSADKNSADENFDRAEVIDKAKTFLTDMFNAMNVEVTINIREVDDNIVLDLVSKDSAFIIGKRGQMIDALQYVTNLAANHASDNPVRFILDVENYRKRREETLIKMAKSVADRVTRIKQSVKMEPMSRHERRIIHTTLQNHKRVETHSYGEDPHRYIVVSPKKKSK
ncbi:MAG: protein jag [Selenomonadaceae bacterium]|nr:protein jag [Selenomonadaceae bacterium]